VPANLRARKRRKYRWIGELVEYSTSPWLLTAVRVADEETMGGRVEVHAAGSGTRGVRWLGIEEGQSEAGERR
jgi:hypothetical protein